MNSFNRLLYTYRFIINRKYYMIIIKDAQNFVFWKKYLHLQYRKNN